MSVLSTSNKKTISEVLVISFQPLFEAFGSRDQFPDRPKCGDKHSVPAPAKQLFRDLRPTLRLEPEFPLQLLERGRGPEQFGRCRVGSVRGARGNSHPYRNSFCRPA